MILRELTRMPRGVHTLLWAQMASQMGDAAFSVLLLWAVLERTDSRLVLGAAATLNYLPILLFGLVGGLAADRLPRRALMIGSDAVRALLCLTLPLLGLAGLANPWVLASAGFLLFTASAFFSPARDAYIPFLVEERDFVAANSTIQTSVPIGWLLGPALCLAFLNVSPAVPLFAGVGLLFLVSVFFLLKLPPQTRGGGHGQSSSLQEIFAGLAISWKDVRLRWLLVITAVDNLFIMGPAVVGTPLLVKEHLGGTGAHYAMMEALLALGALLGLGLTLKLVERTGQGKLLILGILLDGLTYLPLLWVTTLWGAGVAIALHGISIPMITVTRASLIQRLGPPAALGRIFALVNITVLGFTALSSGLTGIVATKVPVNVIFGVIAVAAALCGPAAWMSRRLREC